VKLSLDKTLQQYFPTRENLFDQIMQLRGQVYRALEGRRTQRIELGGKGYFLKQHFGIGWKEILKNLLQLRLPVYSAKNEWLALQRLNKLGVATLQVAGYGQRGKNPARTQSFILTSELTDVVSLEDFCRDWKNTPATFGQKQKLLLAVARIARQLHSNGINHRDFYICHFLLNAQTLASANPQLFLIDLHRAQIRPQTPMRWIIKDLAGLYFSSKDIGLTSRDLLRFIREYRKQPWQEVLARESHFWQKVMQRGDRTYQQHA
jgi:heptose I phosphotransferase